MNPATQPQPAPQLPPQTAEPNAFELRHRDITVTFDTTSITGEPTFHYKDRHLDIERRGAQIRQEKTEIGTLVSITLELTVDTGGTSFSVLIPRVRLAASDQEQPIATLGIRTDNRFSVVPLPGQLERYEVVKLHGTARRVAF